MTEKINLLDIVALTEDIPERGLIRGQIGTVVELLAPGVYEIEFIDNQGRTYATLSAREEQLLILHDRPAKVA
jgi:hypothetical protein